MKTPFFILCILFCGHLFGQDLVQGKIVELSTDSALAYVNIGVKNRNLGTVSDTNGLFELNIPANMDQDSVRISILGYKSIVVTASLLKAWCKEGNSIAMEEDQLLLNEVVLFPKNLKSKVLGNTTQSQNIVAGFVSNELGSEMGIPIKIKESPTYIDNLSVSIVSNDYGTIKFRVNVYDYSEKVPGKKLNTENIYIETDMENGLLYIDLQPYYLAAENDFVICLEWIEDLGKDGLFFSAALASGSTWARQTSQAEWIKKKSAGIGMSVGVKY